MTHVQRRLDVHSFVFLYLQRLERHTQNMDPAQYAEFCESRQLSFGEIVIIWLS